MKRLLPNPLLSAVIVLVWLLLNGLSVGHFLLGALLALALPPLLAPLRPVVPRIHRPLRALSLIAIVIYDIVKSALELAVRILGPQARIRSTYFWLPLDLVDPYAISTLAGIITMTPGTLSSDISDDRRWLLVHCFHTDDVQATITEIKQRYERRLMEIFE